MRIMQLKWSDEDEWKYHMEVDPNKPEQVQLDEQMDSWKHSKRKYNLKHDVELRIVTQNGSLILP